MRTLKTLKPGQKGTRALLIRYSREREAEDPGTLKLDARAGSAARQKIAPRIGWRETDLRRRVKSAGGRWDPVRRVWILRREIAEGLDLLNRVVGGGG